MVAIAPGDPFSTDNPVFETFIAKDSFLLDPFALSFQIFDATSEDAAPTQVYPATVGNRATVDLVNDRIGVGHFIASWTAPGDLATGRHRIRWFCAIEGDKELSWTRDFDVLPWVPDGLADAYALVADVRAEGAAASTKTLRIAEALARSAELIREWTGHDFAPRKKALKIDMRKSLVLMLNEPICAIDFVRYEGSEQNFERDSYRVYARHLRDGMHREDDRDSPRIEMIRHPLEMPYPYVYPSFTSSSDMRHTRRTGAQQVEVDGVFGYTVREQRGCPVGATPPAIRRANTLLALRELPKAGSSTTLDPTKALSIKREKTREQEVEYDTSTTGQTASGSYAPFTGDPEIDRLLLTYCRGLSGTGV